MGEVPGQTWGGGSKQGKVLAQRRLNARHQSTILLITKSRGRRRKALLKRPKDQRRRKHETTRIATIVAVTGRAMMTAQGIATGEIVTGEIVTEEIVAEEIEIGTETGTVIEVDITTLIEAEIVAETEIVRIAVEIEEIVTTTVAETETVITGIEGAAAAVHEDKLKQ
mmetsp:Transcript_52283/g.113628  ORF Transcript_52283/g.113628 Transcript_52283/m.113628 type:complete len:168 (-) Transcript_52283:13-516(-)